jgi:hypothetical protein
MIISTDGDGAGIRSLPGVGGNCNGQPGLGRGRFWEAGTEVVKPAPLCCHAYSYLSFVYVLSEFLIEY